MPRELVIRAPILDDAHAVRDLIDACAQFDGNPQGVSLAELQTFWQIPGFDLARDAWVIDSPDERTAGYLDLYCPAPHDHIYADGWVHPDYRGLGIGRTLVQRAEARARELMTQAPEDARVALYVGAHSGNLAAARLFEREGFSLVRHFWRMSIALHDEPDEPAWPEGITIRGMRAGRDERRVYEVKEEAFQDHYDHRALDYETWLRLNTADRETHDPSLWFIAEEGSEIVGVAICRPRTQTIATEGILPARAALGLALGGRLQPHRRDATLRARRDARRQPARSLREGAAGGVMLPRHVDEEETRFSSSLFFQLVPAAGDRRRVHTS
jgi:mycothiol synthase